MKKFRLLLMMVLAAAVSFTACDTPEKVDDVATPTVTLTLNEEEVYEDAFMAFAATTDAEKAAWIVVAHGDNTVTVDGVFANGTEIPVEELNGEEPAMIIVEDLEPETEYDLFVAVQNKSKKVLSEPLCVTTAVAAPKFAVVEVYPTVCANAMSLTMANVPGHWFTLTNEDYSVMMSLIIVDYSVSVENYSYVASGTYPGVTCASDMGMPIWPTSSALVCEPGFGYVSLYDEATDTSKEYYFVGDKGNDEYGNPFGVDVISLMPDMDNNMITFNIPAVDAEGNEVLIQGNFTGPLGYQVQAAPTTIEFDLNEWGYTDFEATQAEGSNVVKLKKGGPSGDFVMNLTTEGGVIANADGVLYTVEGENLSGYFFDPLDEMDYNFASGGFVLTSTDNPETFTLEVGERRGWTFEGGNKAFTVVPKTYTITVKGLKNSDGGSNSTENVGKDSDNKISF